MTADEKPTTDELFLKHDVALRAFILNRDLDARSELHATQVGLDKRQGELKEDERIAFSQRYWDQVVRVYSEMLTNGRLEEQS
jgi:hypothetical protein